MIFSPLTPQTTFKPYAHRPYGDQTHRRSWDEAAYPAVLPLLMQVVREFLARSPR